ncbi:MAG: hypothetical protein IKP40_05135 [Clostridia bacterium]|nr:hypothetical protein [Clostridia bacterium]
MIDKGPPLNGVFVLKVDDIGFEKVFQEVKSLFDLDAGLVQLVDFFRRIGSVGAEKNGAEIVLLFQICNAFISGSGSARPQVYEAGVNASYPVHQCVDGNRSQASQEATVQCQTDIGYPHSTACSIMPEAVLNLAGIDAQFAR